MTLSAVLPSRPARQRARRSSPTPEPRNLRFDLADVPRYWHGERRSLSLFFDNLSLFFPEGERFFVRA